LSGYLLDSNVVIDWLKGTQAAIELLQRLSDEAEPVAVNAISVAETYSGLFPEDRERVARLIDRFEYWEVDLESARAAGALRFAYARRGRALALADTLLAAQAMVREATLVTNNARDFPYPELRILGTG
jgi:tRNA(fMet)-specific endonuclease VapC